MRLLKWYEVNFKENYPNGVLCWVSNFENAYPKRIDIILRYFSNEKYPFIGINGNWKYAIPVSKDEKPEFLEDISFIKNNNKIRHNAKKIIDLVKSKYGKDYYIAADEENGIRYLEIYVYDWLYPMLKVNVETFDTKIVIDNLKLQGDDIRVFNNIFDNLVEISKTIEGFKSVNL